MDIAGVGEEKCVPGAVISFEAQLFTIEFWLDSKHTIDNIFVHLTNNIWATRPETIHVLRDTIFTWDHTIAGLEALTNVWEGACRGIEVCDELALILVLADFSALLLGVNMVLSV